MGTDIHGRLQHRWDASSKYGDAGGIEDGRNYRVFAMLAGVRNGTGFAGVYTHEPLEPIAEPRGLPDDLGTKGHDYSGDETREIPYDEWEFGDHSFSHVTLKEILDWPGWEKGLEMGGLVDKVEYLRMKASGDTTPREYCGDAWGQGIKIVTEDEVANSEDYSHVRMSWTIPFKDTCPVFYKWVQYLEAKYGWELERDPGAVRLVFGFDS